MIIHYNNETCYEYSVVCYMSPFFSEVLCIIFCGSLIGIKRGQQCQKLSCFFIIDLQQVLTSSIQIQLSLVVSIIGNVR